MQTLGAGENGIVNLKAALDYVNTETDLEVRLMTWEKLADTPIP